MRRRRAFPRPCTLNSRCILLWARGSVWGSRRASASFRRPLLHLMLSRGDSRRTNQHLDSLGGDHECAGSRAR